MSVMGLFPSFMKHWLFCILYVQILKEDPTYPEALVGRGTAYAFQRELSSAIADFTKVLKAPNPNKCRKYCNF